MKEWGQWLTHPACYLVNCTKEIRQQSQFLRKEDWRGVSSELCLCLESTDASTKQRCWIGLSPVWQCRLLPHRPTGGSFCGGTVLRLSTRAFCKSLQLSMLCYLSHKLFLYAQNTPSVYAFKHVFISTDGTEVLPGNGLISAQLWFILVSGVTECSRLSWQHCQ